MTRRDTLQLVEDIVEVLKNEEELSITAIARRVRSRWATTRKALLFLKRLGLVKERPGKKALSPTRLFSLKQ